jgi:hypothetical protein
MAINSDPPRVHSKNEALLKKTIVFVRVDLKFYNLFIKWCKDQIKDNSNLVPLSFKL